MPVYLPLYLRPISGPSSCPTTTCKHRTAILNSSGMGLKTHFNWAVYIKDYFSPLFKKTRKNTKIFLKDKQITFKSALVCPLCVSWFAVWGSSWSWQNLWGGNPRAVHAQSLSQGLVGCIWSLTNHAFGGDRIVFFFLHRWLVVKKPRSFHIWE